MTPTPPVDQHRHAGDRALLLEPKQFGARRREGRAARHQGGRRQDAVRAREKLARARGVPRREARAVAVRIPSGSARVREPPGQEV